MSVAAVNQRSGALIVTCSFGQLFRSATYCLCKKKKKGKKGEEKSIGFHYLVGQCHWPVNDPVTAAVQG